MPRYIEADARNMQQIQIQTGDVLVFQASGGRVLSGEDVLFYMGAFYPSFPDGAEGIVSPQGSPDKVMFQGLRSGEAAIEVIIGDAWQGPRQTHSCQVLVSP